MSGLSPRPTLGVVAIRQKVADLIAARTRLPPRPIRTGALGRCDRCFERRPPAVALRSGTHRLDYPWEVFDSMPVALGRALEDSPNRIR